MIDEIYLRLLIELAPHSVKLSKLDISRIMSQSSKGIETKAAYAKIIKSIYTENPESNIGLIFGNNLHPSTLCDLSRAFITTKNLNELIKFVELYHFTHGASYYPSIHSESGKLSVSLAYPFKAKTNTFQRRFCAEAVFSYITNTLNELVSTQIKPISIEFDFPAPTYTKEYSSWMCPISFNRPLSSITFNDEFFLKQLPTHNEILNPIYLNKCLDDWRNSERLNDLDYRIISLMMQHHPHSFSSEKIAQNLNISVRGLQKRLNKHEQSFSHLSTLARRELCKIYLLQKNIDIEYTAEQLGFQSSSGFRRFFKQEFGQTPAEYQNSFSTTEPCIN